MPALIPDHRLQHGPAGDEPFAQGGFQTGGGVAHKELVDRHGVAC